MDWGKLEVESHYERYEADENSVWGISETRQYWQDKFELQMQDWLEFAWANRDNPKFKTYQGERLQIQGSKGWGPVIGSPTGVRKSNKPMGRKMQNVINTDE